MLSAICIYLIQDQEETITQSRPRKFDFEVWPSSQIMSLHMATRILIRYCTNTTNIYTLLKVNINSIDGTKQNHGVLWFIFYLIKYKSVQFHTLGFHIIIAIRIRQRRTRRNPPQRVNASDEKIFSHFSLSLSLIQCVAHSFISPAECFFTLFSCSFCPLSLPLSSLREIISKNEYITTQPAYLQHCTVPTSTDSIQCIATHYICVLCDVYSL